MYYFRNKSSKISAGGSPP